MECGSRSLGLAPDCLMNTLLSSPYLLLFARLTLGGIFLAGAVGKLIDPAGSVAAFRERTWLPPALRTLASRWLPWAEAVVGGLLLLGLALPWAAFAAAALLVVFTVVVLGDLRGGRPMPCHCFGRFSQENAGPATVARNVVLLALAVLLATQPAPYLALDAVFGAAQGLVLPPLVNAVPVVFLALIAVVAVVLGNSLLATIRSFLRAF
jgi:uncharacterized membrane protein YphA (DoxX/SURF4 family)